MKLSVAMATFNEERNIEACLNSIRGWADEIILVDGGSKDETTKIAQRCGAKVTITDNPLIFHINKQKAVDLATNDWILQLDADESVTLELQEEITRIINSSPLNNGYWIPRKNYFLNHWMEKGGQYPDQVIRLFRKGKGKFPCKSVHEQIKIDGSVGILRKPLIHLAFPTYDEYLRKLETYTNLRKEEIKKQIQRPSLFHNVRYLLFSPLKIFYSRFLRHKGFMDGLPGFIYAASSGYQEMVAYGKFWTEASYANVHK